MQLDVIVFLYKCCTILMVCVYCILIIACPCVLYFIFVRIYEVYYSKNIYINSSREERLLPTTWQWRSQPLSDARAHIFIHTMPVYKYSCEFSY